MKKNGNGATSNFRVGMTIAGSTDFLREDFDQDGLTGRFGKSRDRRVVEKSRLARSKPRRFPGDVTVR
jgi:hypothetical protein